jgi:hypothetical protein
MMLTLASWFLALVLALGMWLQNPSDSGMPDSPPQKPVPIQPAAPAGKQREPVMAHAARGEIEVAIRNFEAVGKDIT